MPKIMQAAACPQRRDAHTARGLAATRGDADCNLERAEGDAQARRARAAMPKIVQAMQLALKGAMLKESAGSPRHAATPKTTHR